MKLVQACLSGRKPRESSSHRCRGCCEPRANLFMCGEGPEICRGGPVKFVEASLSVSVRKLGKASLTAGKVGQSSFNHCMGAVKLMQACLSVRNDRGWSFNHRGGLVKLLVAC